MENWTKSGTLNIDGRLKPLVRETMPSSLSSLGGQKKMIMVEDSPKKKKLKTKKKNNNNNNNTTKFSAGGGGGFQQQQGQNETRARNTKQLGLVDAWKRRDNAGAPSPSPSPSLAPRKKPKTTVATSSSSSSLSKKSGTKSEFVRGLAMKARPLSSHAHPLSTSFSSSSSSSLRMTTTQTTTPSKAKRRTAKPPTSTFTTPDDDESDANISGIAFKSLVSTWNDASVSEREELLKKITGCDPLQLKYVEKEVIDFLTFSIEIDKIIHRQQYLNDESWFRWVQERQNFHDTCEEIHLNSSRYIKREIAKQLLEERHRLGDALFWEAMGDEDSFLSHNTHWLIVVERGAPEKTRTLRASEYTDIMMEKGRENIVESTILNGCMAGLHQQGLVQSDPKGGRCTTKFVLFDLFYCTAEQAFFNENENIQYVLFSCSDLLASIGPKHWKANNEGFIPRDEVIDLHVRARPKQGYAGIAGKIVVEAMRLSAEALAKLCQKYNIFIIVHSAKVRNVLAGSETRVRLRLWFERTLAHSCAPCCHAFGGRWSGLSISLTSLQLCMLMQQLGHGGIELALLSETNSDAFLKVKEALKEATFGKTTSGEITDERLEELASNHCERLLCYKGEFAADDDDDGPQTFHALLSCFGRKGSKAWHAKQGHFDRTKDSTGYNACAELAELGWLEDQVRNVLNEDLRGKGFSLYRAYLKTQPQLPLRFRCTPYYTTFGWLCDYERDVEKSGRAPKNGTEREPVETLGAVKKLKDLAEEGKPPSVSRYAYVPKEEGTDEEKLKQLQKAIGMDDESQYIGLRYQAINSLKGHRKRGANLWNLVSTGYLACQKLQKDDWTADSLHRELQNRSAQEIFSKFCEYADVVLAPMNKSDHPYFEYVSRRSRKDKKYSTDEERQGTLRAIFMLQELVRKIEAGEVTSPTGENLE